MPMMVVVFMRYPLPIAYPVIICHFDERCVSAGAESNPPAVARRSSIVNRGRHAPGNRRSVEHMTRRIDYVAAEKLSLALLTRAAFGELAGERAALLAGVAAPLIETVFSRYAAMTRFEIQGAVVHSDRRSKRR